MRWLSESQLDQRVIQSTLALRAQDSTELRRNERIIRKVGHAAWFDAGFGSPAYNAEILNDRGVCARRMIHGERRLLWELGDSSADYFLSRMQSSLGAELRRRSRELQRSRRVPSVCARHYETRRLISRWSMRPIASGFPRIFRFSRMPARFVQRARPRAWWNCKLTAIAWSPSVVIIIDRYDCLSGWTWFQTHPHGDTRDLAGGYVRGTPDRSWFFMNYKARAFIYPLRCRERGTERSLRGSIFNARRRRRLRSPQK